MAFGYLDDDNDDEENKTKNNNIQDINMKFVSHFVSRRHLFDCLPNHFEYFHESSQKSILCDILCD